MKKKYFFMGAFLALIALMVLVFSASEFIINLQWFKDVDYVEMFFIRVVTMLKVILPIFAIAFMGIILYYRCLLKGLPKLKASIEKIISKKVERGIIIALALLIALLFSYSIANKYWYIILEFFNSASFNKADPIFNMDISFYVFKLPLIQALYNNLLTIVTLFTIATFIAYIISISKDRIREGFRNKKVINFSGGLSSFLGKQMAVLAALIMIMIAIGYMLRSFYLVYSDRGVAYGANYTDVKVTLIFFRIIIAIGIISSIVIFTSILKKKLKPIIITISAMFFVIILQPIAANTVQQFKVNPNEYELEEKYINYNIEYTKEAYNIDDIEEIDFNFEDKLTEEDIKENEDIIDNLKINSFEQVYDFYNQVQVIKNYYTFNDVDTDRYLINGDYTQVFISPREIDSSDIGSVWQNKHLRYTHGYGLAMSRVNSVTSEGQPDYVIKDIPPVNSTDIKINNPRIYFGESTDSYAIVNTDIMEFDYPKGEETQEYRYEGQGGIKLNLLNRILFAIHEGEPKLILSDAINGDSKLLLNRNIIDRVEKIAPFLTYGKDPYLVINEGELIWVIDAYTVSDKYPYSQPYGDINYIRNSIKATVNAYDGEVNFYIVDEEDPIARCYNDIYKGLFKSNEEVPEGIRSHYRYPSELFELQCDVLTTYHITNPYTFYTDEDIWQVSTLNTETGNEERVNESPYVMTKLINEEDPEMILLEYFNMKGKQNMSSIFGARMDRDNYGKLIMYKFPTQKTVYSPGLFINKINQDTNISKEISLWNSKGSSVEFGDTLVIPINESLLYVQTLYLRSSDTNSIPEMKRVILYDGESLVIEETVDKALLSLFNYSGDGEQVPVDNNSGSPGEEGDLKDTMDKARELYEKAIEAQKNGDWAAYDEYMEELGNILINGR
ncbi:UPF0182 family protein [Alloiococcus sp. CFN-8]|uniref:UPF0182 family membrane protein n=1 Tax=Alloiococcus sp. CFN-8 TaxID=3416081 RepID=UPI003CE8AAD7